MIAKISTFKTQIKLYIFVFSISCSTLFSQVSGNVNYQNQSKRHEENISISYPSMNEIVLNVKGLANAKADNYVAIFSVVQVGRTTEEANEMVDKRIADAVSSILEIKGTEVDLDMISFVPIYEYEIEKKAFSKKTYNEIPKGFEVRKNIHIKYSKPADLNGIIKALSNQEIYDLVKVDYILNNQEIIRKELSVKAKEILQDKMKNVESILGFSFNSLDKTISDGYKIVLPVDMYKTYESYSSSSLNLKKSANVNVADKSSTMYYQPISNKEFDFVINPVIIEPVVQIMYEIVLVIKKEPKTPSPNKQFYIITPTGELKPLNLDK